jgi:hypothetical protein
MNDTPDSLTTGRCHCGDIAFEFEGKPKWVMHCHCESCRRGASSVIATYVGLRASQFRYTRGAPAFYASSPGVKRYFCSRCGVPVAFTGERWPDEVHIFYGTLDDPARWVPTGHAYVGEQVPWFDVHDDLPRFETTGGRKAVPLRHGPKTTA